MNQQLRSIFSQISFPSPDVQFFYDRSAKLSDSSFYSNNSSDTLYQTTWFDLYDEMYYAAHDTTTLSTHEYLQSYSDSYSSDTIPIGIFDFDWYYCINNSLTTSTYFIFDTINDLLYDNPNRPGSPFGQANIFAVSPLRNAANFINPTFRIDPVLFLSDVINSSLYSSVTFRIDFGDGAGWQYFDPTLVSHYQVNYAGSGMKVIRAELLDERGDVIKGSNSSMNILKDDAHVSPDYTFELPGLQIGVYQGCELSNEKFIIYLEGIDIMDMNKSLSRGIDDIYYDMIHEEHIEELRNFNYTYFVVNWKNSRIDMRFNALHVVNLIEYLKKKFEWSDEQLVIIGESKGGVIARYALTYMESPAYKINDYSPFFVDAADPGNMTYLALHPNLLTLGLENKVQALNPLMHKTRELITIDSPHQGANIPLSIQIAYKEVIGRVFPSFRNYTEAFNMGLESQAAEQLLLYHLKGKITPLSTVSGYLPAPEHASFYGQLRLLGDYPRYCKLMALSSGAINGKKQRNYDNTADRNPSDLLFGLNYWYGVKILNHILPFYGARLDLYTNPNGTGTVFDGGIGLHTFKLKVKFWKIKIESTYAGIYNEQHVAVNVKPYCTNAGGFYSTIYMPSLPAKLNQMDLFNGLGNATYTNGCVFANRTLPEGNTGYNAGYYICSNRTHFGFIPLQSALDYGNGLNSPLNHDIQNENINIKLSRTPFDVIMGYSDGINRSHLDYRDEYIYNITQAPASYCGNFDSPGELEYGAAYYDADQLNNFQSCKVRRSLLCLEIGDEERHLENWDLNRIASFQAEYDLHVNKRNPYYEYAGFNGPLNISGVYSKKDNFIITPTGYAKFFYNTNDSPTGIGFSYVNQQNQTYWFRSDAQMPVCVNDYAMKSNFTSNESANLESKLEENELLLIPNPASGSSVFCSYRLHGNNTSTIVQLLDATGKQLQQLEVSSEVNQVSLALDNLQQGLYFVSVANGENRIVKQLIIQK